MPVSLSGIIHHSHSFTRLEIYHHIYFTFVLIIGSFKWTNTVDLIYVFFSLFLTPVGFSLTWISNSLKAVLRCLRGDLKEWGIYQMRQCPFAYLKANLNGLYCLHNNRYWHFSLLLFEPPFFFCSSSPLFFRNDEWNQGETARHITLPWTEASSNKRACCCV